MEKPAQPPTRWPLQRVPAPPAASVAVVIAVPVIYVALTAYFQLLVRASPNEWFPPVVWLPRATHRLINGTFVANATIALVLIPGIMLLTCRFRASEIGLDPGKIRRAVGCTACIWAGNQVVVLIVLAAAGKGIAFNSEWTAASWPRALGDWFAQLFANTPLEETVFRGFLLPQCCLLVLKWMPKSHAGIQILVSVAVSQTLFALVHVFFNSYQPEGQWLLLAQFVGGVVFAVVYLRTGNLFLAMGLHTLVNNPSPLLREYFHAGEVAAFAATLLIAICPGVVPGARAAVNHRE